MPRVVIANVARNHCYPIVEAAAEAGYLERFITSIYDRPSTLEGRVLRALTRRLGRSEELRLAGRRSNRIPDDRVVTIPAPELAEQAAMRAARALHLDPRPSTYAKCAVFDLAASRHVVPCDIFHGFEQATLACLRRAHALGATTVLDQPIMHIDALLALEARECERLGRVVPRRPLGFSAHVHRKHREQDESDFVFVGLDFVKRTMVENGGFDPDRVFVIPYGAEVSDYQVVDRSARTGLEVLYVGPLHYWKGLHYLLDAFAGLGVPGARLTIIGRADPDWEAFFRPRVEALGSSARWIAGVPHAELARHYAEADVLAFPSLVGGIGLVCYEAMATGLPVLTSDGDVVIRNGEDGVCVAADDIEGWRRALTRLAHEPDLRARLGRAGADRVRAFSWDTYRRGIVRAYDEIAARRAAHFARRRAS